MLTRARLIAATVLATASVGCGDESGSESRLDASVCEVASGRIATGTELRLSGRAWQLPPTAPDAGFALADEGCTVFVAAESFETVDARGGDLVDVAAIVRRLEPAEVRRLTRRQTAQPARMEIDQARDLNVGVGTPFASAMSVTGEDLVPGSGEG